MFTTRKGGNSKDSYATFNLGLNSGDSLGFVSANRNLLSKCLGSNNKGIFFPRQVHGTRIVTLKGHSNSPDQEIIADGVITQDKGYAISILTADCLPIILVDPKTETIGLIHAGWRSSLGNITSKTIDLLTHKIGVRPHTLLVGFGPSIRGCCYQVGEEIAELTKEQFPNDEELVYPKNGSDHFFMDLVRLNKLILLHSGIPEENILDCGLCTCCQNDLFFSYRAQHGVTGRQAALGMWR